MNSDTPHPDATFRGFSPGDRVFGRFVLEKMVGRGGMGVVWAAHDTRLDQRVALKFLPDALFWDRSARQQITEETRKARLLTHPHIVRIHDLFEDDQHAAICMELVDGADLNSLKSERDNGVFEPAELEGWLREIAEALDYAHREVGVIHRDLKPANILITQTGKAKISDFGVARSIAETMTRVSSFSGAGTLAYMSPQQYDGDAPLPSDDWYALGATLYDLITSRPPFFRGAVPDQIRNRVPESMAVRRQQLKIDGDPIPSGWEELVAACLDKNPSGRPADVSSLQALLAGAARGGRTKAARRLALPGWWLVAVTLVVGFAIGRSYLAGPKSVSAPSEGNADQRAAASSFAAISGQDRSETNTLFRLPLDQDILDAGPHALGTKVEGVRLGEVQDGIAGLRFDGRGYVEIESTDRLALTPGEGFRLSMMIKPDRDEARTAQVLVVLGRERVGAFHFISQREGDDLNVHFGLTQSPEFLQILAPGVLREDVWQRVEFEYAHGVAGVWIDGILVGYAEEMLPSPLSNDPATIRFGTANEGARGFVGLMRDVSMERIEAGATARLATAQSSSWLDQVALSAIGSPFAVLEGRVSETEDLATIVAHRFGDEAMLADWAEFKRWLEIQSDPGLALDRMGLGFQENAFLTWEGARMTDDARQYFVTRMNGTVPEYYLAHDSAADQLVTLGSWRGVSMPILVMTDGEEVFLPVEDEYTLGRTRDDSAWRWLRGDAVRVREDERSLEILPGESPLVLERAIQGGVNREQLSFALQFRFGANPWGAGLTSYFRFVDGSRVELNNEVVEGRHDVQAIRLVNGDGRSEFREVVQRLGSQEMVISFRSDRLRGTSREVADRRLLFESSMEIERQDDLPVAVGVEINHPSGAPIRIDWIKFSAAIEPGNFQQ